MGQPQNIDVYLSTFFVEFTAEPSRTDQRVWEAANKIPLIVPSSELLAKINAYMPVHEIQAIAHDIDPDSGQYSIRDLGFPPLPGLPKSFNIGDIWHPWGVSRGAVYVGLIDKVGRDQIASYSVSQMGLVVVVDGVRYPWDNLRVQQLIPLNPKATGDELWLVALSSKLKARMPTLVNIDFTIANAWREFLLSAGYDAYEIRNNPTIPSVYGKPNFPVNVGRNRSYVDVIAANVGLMLTHRRTYYNDTIPLPDPSEVQTYAQAATAFNSAYASFQDRIMFGGVRPADGNFHSTYRPALIQTIQPYFSMWRGPNPAVVGAVSTGSFGIVDFPGRYSGSGSSGETLYLSTASPLITETTHANYSATLAASQALAKQLAQDAYDCLSMPQCDVVFNGWIDWPAIGGYDVLYRLRADLDQCYTRVTSKPPDWVPTVFHHEVSTIPKGTSSVYGAGNGLDQYDYFLKLYQGGYWGKLVSVDGGNNWTWTIEPGGATSVAGFTLGTARVTVGTHATPAVNDVVRMQLANPLDAASPQWWFTN